MSLSIAALAERAKQELSSITGYRPAAVVGSFRDAEGWHLLVDLVEMARLPESTDLLGTYEVTVDEAGNLLKFERKSARLRGTPDQEKES